MGIRDSHEAGAVYAIEDIFVGPVPERSADGTVPVAYTHLPAHETVLDLVCGLLPEKNKM